MQVTIIVVQEIIEKVEQINLGMLFEKCSLLKKGSEPFLHSSSGLSFSKETALKFPLNLLIAGLSVPKNQERRMSREVSHI